MATLTSRLIVSLKDMVSGPARGVGASLARLEDRARRTNGVFMGAGGAFGGGLLRGALAVGASYYGVSKAIGGTVGAAIKFEEAFADVRKVVDGTPGQLAQIRSEIVGMSKELPVTAAGIADIYAAAGQSNVPLNELGKFAEMAAKVSVAWDTAQGETGDALAKIKTQLGFNVSELGLHADAINHLSNNTASAASDLVDFDKRVAATGKMIGFTDTQTLAFGASMISAGAQSEVAATSFRNMGRALTKGARATKQQRDAYAKLGLDSVKVAKHMQKDALGTTLDVIEKIQKLPEWQQISIASALFGDEARALMPVIGNTTELRRELALVGTEANYAGSAFKEYLVRSETTANALQLLWNKVRGVGIGIGDSWLPTVKQFALGVGDVLDTLKSRVGIFDQLKASVSGFMTGIGYGGNGGVRALVNDLGDLLFGKAFSGQLRDADERVTALALLSNKFRGIGRDLRSFADDVTGGNVGAAIGNIGHAISNLGGGLTVGGALAIGATGWALLKLGEGAAALAFSKAGRIFFTAYAIAMLIGAVKDANSLGEFVTNLEGLSTIQWVAIAGGITMLVGPLGKIAQFLGLIKKAGGIAAVTRGAGVGAAAAAGAEGVGAGLVAGAGLAAGAIAGTGYVIRTLDADNRAADRRLATHRGAERRFSERDPDYMRSYRQALDMIDERRNGGQSSGGFLSGLHAIDNWLTSKFPSLKANTGAPAEVTVTAPIETRPSGTQDVRVTNPMPAPVINMTINAQTNASPEEIGAAVKRSISEEMNALSHGAYSDGAN